MTEIFDRLLQEKISPNAYYVLDCIKENVIPNSFVNKELECQRLKNDGWLTDSLELTSKSAIFMAEINGYFKKSKKKTTKALLGEDFNEKIKEYVELFPNKKLPSGKHARVNPKNLEIAFRWFFETYDYTWETILTATEKYVLEYSMRNYDYMRTSQFFVRKQNVDKSFESELANYCTLLESGEDLDKNYFSERVV